MQVDPDHYLRLVIFTFLGLTLLLSVSNNLNTVFKSIKCFGWKYWRLLPEMWELSSKRYIISLNSRRPPLITALVLSGIGLAISYFTHRYSSGNIDWIFLLGFFVFSWALSYFLTTLFGYPVPPIILVLGASSEESTALQAELDNKLRKRIGRGAVLSLLNVTRFGEPGVTVEFLGGAQRTHDESWPDVVRSLMGIAKIIVLDSRQVSTLVEDEVRWIESNGYTSKVLVLASQNSELLKPFKNFAKDSEEIIERINESIDSNFSLDIVDQEQANQEIESSEQGSGGNG